MGILVGHTGIVVVDVLIFRLSASSRVRGSLRSSLTPVSRGAPTTGPSIYERGDERKRRGVLQWPELWFLGSTPTRSNPRRILQSGATLASDTPRDTTRHVDVKVSKLGASYSATLAASRAGMV